MLSQWCWLIPYGLSDKQAALQIEPLSFKLDGLLLQPIYWLDVNALMENELPFFILPLWLDEPFFAFGWILKFDSEFHSIILR